jgi:ACS family pantothenate transporter-like MFS transporter
VVATHHHAHRGCHGGAVTSAPISEKKDGAIVEATPSYIASDAGKDTEASRQPEGQRIVPGFFHWHEPGTSKEEKKLIFKIDFYLLTFSCLMFFLKQLYQNNVANVYVSGMADALGFGPGDELSWMNTYFLIGTIVGGTASNMILTIVPPRFWLSGCLFVWSLFVLFLYKCNTATEFYVLRFFIGLFESAAWPGLMYVLGCWYRRSELARRSGLFVVSGVLGQMFSGYLQAALFTGMEGKGGMPAWRWLFIFDFILAIPVVIYGLVGSINQLLAYAITNKPHRYAIPIRLTRPRPFGSTTGRSAASASALMRRAEHPPAR